MKRSKQAAKGGSFRYHPPLAGYCTVDCDLCERRETFKGGRAKSGQAVSVHLPEARKRASSKGWVEYKRGHWVCPICVEEAMRETSEQ